MHNFRKHFARAVQFRFYKIVFSQKNVTNSKIYIIDWKISNCVNKHSIKWNYLQDSEIEIYMLQREGHYMLSYFGDFFHVTYADVCPRQEPEPSNTMTHFPVYEPSRERIIVGVNNVSTSIYNNSFTRSA